MRTFIFPYIPIHKKEDIKMNMIQSEVKADWTNVFRNVRHWCTIAEEYRYKNPSEFGHITTVLKEYWNDFKSNNHVLNDEDELTLLIIEEDFDFLIK